MIYPGPLGRILIQSDESLILYDISARKVMSEIQIAEVKRVYWNQNYTYCAVITKSCKIFSIIYILELLIVNKTLDIVN